MQLSVPLSNKQKYTAKNFLMSVYAFLHTCGELLYILTPVKTIKFNEPVWGMSRCVCLHLVLSFYCLRFALSPVAVKQQILFACGKDTFYHFTTTTV